MLADSEAWFEEPPHPCEDAPNVVVVLLDDTGFAQFGCYGSTTEDISCLASIEMCNGRSWHSVKHRVRRHRGSRCAS